MLTMHTFNVDVRTSKGTGKRGRWSTVLTTRAFTAAQARDKAESRGLLAGKGAGSVRARMAKTNEAPQVSLRRSRSSVDGGC